MEKRFASWLFAVALLLPLAAVAQLPVVQQLSTTVPVYDPMGGIKMGISGLFERSITVSGTNRTIKLYVPQGAVLGSYMVVMTVPDGASTVQWLVDSGWISLADQKKFLLYVFEPNQATGSWGTTATELPYITAAYNNISINGNNGRGTWYLPPESYYVAGYGSAGAALQQVVMNDPTLVGAAAFVDASSIDSQYLAQMATTFYSTPDWNGNSVASANVPMPVWIISGDLTGNTAGVIDYWKRANLTVEPSAPFLGGQIFDQLEDALDGYVAHSVSSVAVLQQQNASTDPTLSAKIYNSFLSHYTRYGGNVGGNTVGTRPDYAALGVEYHSFPLNGRLREYFVYVPQKAKTAAQNGQKVPLVFALHGANLTMYSHFDFSRWWEIADEKGFILIVPTGLNTNNGTSWITSATGIDMTFIQMLINTMKADYNVDPDRIYLGGQSIGCSMSQAIGRNLSLSPNFATVACTSFPTSSTNFAGELLPFYMTYGEYDSTVGSWQLTTPGLANDLNYWITRDQALGTPTTPASVQTIGRHRIYKWNNANALNVVRYSVTLGRGHSITPDDTWKLWNWYDLWQKDVNGTNVMVGLADCTSPSDPALASSGCMPGLSLQVVPSVVNLKVLTGVMQVVLTAAPGYDLSQWTLSEPKIGNQTPLNVAATSDGRTYALTFHKAALSWLATGNSVPVSLTATLTRNGRHGPTAATTTVRILR